jgi:hypothetical protein
MPKWENWPGFAEVQALLDRLENPDVEPLLKDLEGLVWRDNRDKVLSGVDRDGETTKRTVRQSLGTGHWVTYLKPDGKPARYYQAGRSKGPDCPPWFHGDGDGEALAPHDLDSRVIANLVTAHGMTGPGEWQVIGLWENVVSDDGVPFLPFHFRGEGRLPQRRLDGVTPLGREKAVAMVDAWARAALLGQGNGGSNGP